MPKCDFPILKNRTKRPKLHHKILIKQHAINSATLISWTKGFCATNVEGHNVVGLLEEALGRRNEIKVEIVAVVNDTVGTMN